MKPRALLAFLPLALASCASAPPLYDNLGHGTRAVTAASAAVQPWFDQGLTLCWGFNHDEAVRSFEQALRLDPSCAMAQWGIALALGPNLNSRPSDEAVWQHAYRASREALALDGGCTTVERELITAMQTRYADPPPKDRGDLDRAYAQAMGEVFARHPDDADVGTLYADALMNIDQNWRQWGTDTTRGEYTPTILSTLAAVLTAHPEHAGANHLWIHAVEASDHPERALDAARRLGSLVPGSGHLVHMPSHIYIRLGMYQDAIECNAAAVAQDDAFFALRPSRGTYQGYRAHNHHFLVWAALFQGSREIALDAARAMVGKLRDALGDLPISYESYLFVPMHVMMRFGMWDEMLRERAPGERFTVATALWHHGRAIALANTERIEEARAEAAAFETVVATIPKDRRVRRATIEHLMGAARGMMNGEILFRQGRQDEAFAALRDGIAHEDAMPYSEPPGWMQPIRHSLGALLLEAGRVAEAETVYREDLKQHADNVWSLHGLAECLRRQDRIAEAVAIETTLQHAAAHADVAITSSCFCRRK
ncbi:MAG: hypothetical protein U1F36_04930 [Planctomycetota bacterium]